MINMRFILLFFFGFFIGLDSTAQIENHSLSYIKPPLEIQFQNYFYEGLKQKDIDNYNKAIDAFVKCAELGNFSLSDSINKSSSQRLGSRRQYTVRGFFVLREGK